ncbi:MULTISPECIES: hypothetical protein [unclassified Roseateles]|uniref:hypothetical protein n=1 Tax=unclassified Roseateles TaxID=2626991 RepID=UPI0007151960|nr:MULTISPECIES: hypothetical protein [unclassified Roseateles]KQW42322.1 hypothetical protein ASC81_20910 [Pelomonas sp. Root405]KRA68196.1 hypothetical protein ASD88_22495 [Pelomonas sp. Root662]
MSVSNGDEIVLVSHLPLVCIAADSVPFAGGDLWRMPFEVFDALTVGAFSDHQKAYAAMAPVFLRVVLRARLPNVVALHEPQARSSSLQLKLPERSWPLLTEFGLDILVRFHDLAVQPAWQALLLQAPDAVLPPPRWSLTLAIADEGFGFSGGEQPSRVASVHGDADIEYLISDGFPTRHFDSAELEAAAVWTERLSAATSVDARLGPALDALAECASPLLGAAERTVLATMALETLLLPEARSGLSATLERRLGHLLGRDEAERQHSRASARALYKARSASVHGETPSPHDAAGGAWLAAAIIALDRQSTASATAVADLLPRLDEQPLGEALPRSAPPCAPALLRARTSRVAIVAPELASPEEGWLMWAPLPGLLNHQPLALDDERRRLLLSLSGHELLMLEERDIARDFAGALRAQEDEIAALCLLVPGDDEDAAGAMARLQQERDLAVAALRLAGLHGFCDPALAGPVAMRKAIRFRQPSVLRQSVWQIVAHKRDEATALQPAHAAPLASAWRTVDDYRRAGGHGDLDRALSLYRRGFDRRFNTTHACAGLHFATIESLLGRFRMPGDAMPLEALVTRLLGEQHASAAWFVSDGRALRNAVAHGRATEGVEHTALDALATIAGAAWRRAAQLQAGEPADPTRPGKRLVRALTA